MKKVYDFSKAKRGAVVSSAGKTRITIYVDDAVIKRFKAQSQKTLKSHVGLTEQPVTQELVRKIVREELAASS
jgi:hypothetical protein